jgi:hypothetical protein
MGHHKARSRSTISFGTPNSKRHAVATPGVKRYSYVYKTDTNFATEFALTSIDLAQLSSFVREFEHCAISYWLGQHYERRKGRLKVDIGAMDAVQPFFGKEVRVVPEWRLQRLRGWPLAALMLKNEDAREWYSRVYRRATAIRAFRRARRKQQILDLGQVARIGHEQR